MEVTPQRKEKTSKAMENLLTTTSIKNIFDNEVEFFNIRDERVTSSNENAMDIDFGENIRLETFARQEKRQIEILEEQNHRLMNSEIQKAIQE